MNYKKESEMFNQAASYYDKYRPGYPTEVIDAIINLTELKDGAQLLEIGCGSGKATEYFVNRNYHILGIDPGEDLVKIGNEKFKDKNVIFKK